MLDKILVKEVIAPILIVIGAFALYKIIKKVLKKLLKLKKNPDRRQKTILSVSTNIIKYFIVIIAILMILEVFGIDTKTIVASLSVVGLVIGLALQDILKDFIGGMSIIFENQFGIGDNVTINN